MLKNILLNTFYTIEHVPLGCPEFLRPAFTAPQPIYILTRTHQEMR